MSSEQNKFKEKGTFVFISLEGHYRESIYQQTKLRVPGLSRDTDTC